MGHCERCDQESPLISFPLNLCASCIRSAFDDVLPRIRAVHGRSRTSFGLPAAPPRFEHGLTCAFCTNQCRLGPEERGFCGTRQNASGRLRGGGPREGNLSWYYDPLPTNCVADWVCPGGTGCGYPEYAHSQGPEHGYKNLAVFFHSCSFDCLFCQNWHYREHSTEPGRRHLDFLTDGVDERTSCICYFGGDPTPHLPYAIAASRRALEKNPGRILRICWETNGAMNPKLADRMASLSLKTGGCVKFDLKAHSRGVYL
ncbi:MAG: radical SAM protein, partial [Candidatus Aminicenantales bacterium]